MRIFAMTLMACAFAFLLYVGIAWLSRLMGRSLSEATKNIDDSFNVTGPVEPPKEFFDE